MKTIDLRKKSEFSPAQNKIIFDKELMQTAEQIIEDVRINGDAGVKKYTKQFDKVSLKKIKVSKTEIQKSIKKVSKKFIKSCEKAVLRIWDYHTHQIENSWFESREGEYIGQAVRPIDRVGVYVPGGTAPLVSTVMMTVIPAKIAGAKEIALVTPPDKKGKVNEHILAICELLGIYEVYTIGGVQAIAALSIGTETVKKVDKVVGPGNKYVAAAKKLLIGEVGIDILAGPSEICIIADKSAKPEYIAADLLSQAEHDSDARTFLITDSIGLKNKVVKEVETQLKKLKRKKIAIKAMDNSIIYIVKDIAQALELSNDIAPEHLEILVKKPFYALEKINNAGCVFLGEYSPEPMGDYIAGSNHTLPTSGQSRFSSALGVYDFIKRISVVNFSKKKFNKLCSYAMEIAKVEGLEAHYKSLHIRKKV